MRKRGRRVVNSMIETHPYQVRKWLPVEPALKYLGQAHWMEECRCRTQQRAEWIAQALHITGHGLLAVVKFNDPTEDDDKPRVEYLAWYPDKETVERETQTQVKQS